MKRIPLWLTVVPLVVGLAVYWRFWSGWRDTLRADVTTAIPGSVMKIGGFPYRLEADVAAPRYTLRGPVAVTLTAIRARVNRNPWQRDLTAIRTERPAATVDLGLAGATASVTAASGASSIHLSPRGIARLSTVLSQARGRTGLFAAPFIADSLEVHLRETRARSNEAWSATPPQQAQVVIAGSRVRFGDGAPLTLAVDAGVTAVSRLTSLAAWAAGGTVELRAVTLTDASGEIARLVASVVPAGGGVRLNGTVTTVCPATVAATVAGTRAPVESRLRNPVRLTFGGVTGAFELGPMSNTAPMGVRAQLPPCPRLS